MKNFWRLIWKPTNLFVALAIVLILAVSVFAEYYLRRLNEERLRTDVLAHVSVIRAKLEGHINGNLELVRGLVSTISTEPGIGEERFSRLVKALVDSKDQIRSISVAPGLVIAMIYPREGNDSVLGLDYAQDEIHRPMVEQARQTGAPVLQGPVNLIQDNSSAFIGRFPVFASEQDESRRFWGLVSVVIRADEIFRDSGMLAEDLPLNLAIAGRDGKGRNGAHFFGDPQLFSQSPVLSEVVFPSGSWVLAATPKEGWNQTPGNIWLARFIILAGGIVVLVAAFMAGRLVTERLRTVDELRRREVELERLSRRLTLALDSSRIGVWELNTATDELFWDDRVNQIYGFPQDGGPRTYKDWERSIHPDDLDNVLTQARRNTVDGEAFQTQYRLLLPDGQIRHLREGAKTYVDKDGTVRIVGVNWDVTADVLLNQKLKRAKLLTEARNVALRVAKERIEFNALHDSLTGLPNRRYLDQILASHAEKFYSGGEYAGLLHLDLDRFKQINDTLGHAAGDAMLIHAAGVVKSHLRPGDFVARVGGDEFIVLCKIDDADATRWEETLSLRAEKIIEQMNQPIPFEGHECRSGISIGIACDVDQSSDPRRLLVNADLALNRAKSRGRSHYQFFNDALRAQIVTTKRVADDILRGLERNEFVPYYQPQFDAETYEIVGVEALVRWNHPVDGILAPVDFIKIAEELNVLATIDRMILEQVLEDMDVWAREGLGVPKASVNVSARRLNDEELIRSLRELSIKKGTIAFELVESIFLDDNDDQLIWNVEQIKALGIDIEIDDFGTGYASIVSLLKLRPRRLKIDRQLVTPILSSLMQRQLVGSIIEIGRSLGIEVLAEGVESMEHATVLRSLGCNALQGHAFARAMSPAEFRDFARRRKNGPLLDVRHVHGLKIAL